LPQNAKIRLEPVTVQNVYKIEAIMNGDIDELIDALITADRAEKLKASSDE
jgi:protein subunit release factor A